MSPAVFLSRWAVRGCWLLVLLACVLGAVVALCTRRAGEAARVPPPAAPAPAPEWPLPATWEGLDLSLLRSRARPSLGGDDIMARRFRLAGTFFEFTASGSGVRRAILDDRSTGDQVLVRERDRLEPDVEVVQIMRDRVTLCDDAGRETVLTLNFSDGGSLSAAQSATNAGAGEDSAAARFGGTRVGEDRWVFQRENLMRYYETLRDQPERLVLLFDSLKPVYTASGAITGYELGVEGEQEFFDAVGLVAGDVVRKVNNVDMTNRRRAEFFIKQFVRDESSAFMLDVERGGVTNRLVYELR